MLTRVATAWASLKHAMLREEKPDAKRDLRHDSMYMEYRAPCEEHTHGAENRLAVARHWGQKWRGDSFLGLGVFLWENKTVLGLDRGAVVQYREFC